MTRHGFILALAFASTGCASVIERAAKVIRVAGSEAAVECAIEARQAYEQCASAGHPDAACVDAGSDAYSSCYRLVQEQLDALGRSAREAEYGVATCSGCGIVVNAFGDLPSKSKGHMSEEDGWFCGRCLGIADLAIVEGGPDGA